VSIYYLRGNRQE